MRKTQFLLVLLALGLVALSGCKDDDTPETSNLTLNITGLQNLGSDYAYEGWIMVDGSPVSAGIFSVDAAGNMSKDGICH